MPNAELRAQLSCDNKPFINSMNQAVAKGKQAGTAIASSFKSLGPSLGAAFSVGAIAAAARSVVAFGSEINDMSDAIGISSDKFQQFSFAVEQSGGSQENFTKGMAALISKMEDAKNGNVAAIASFERLEISLSDIKNKSPDQILLMIADALKKSGGSGEAFAATADIIGSKIALKMVPALKAGSEEFLKLANSASIAGKDTISALDDIGDRWDRLKRKVMSAEAEGLVGLIQLLNGGAGSSSTAAATAGDMATAKFNAAMRQTSGAQSPVYANAAANRKAQIEEATKEAEEITARFWKTWSDTHKPVTGDMSQAEAEGIRSADELRGIWKEIQDIELETARSSMDASEQVVSLQKQRTDLLREAARLEGEGERAAGARLELEAARIGQRISGISVAGGRDTGGQFGPSPAEFRNRGAAIGAGGLMSSGLMGGGLLTAAGAYGGVGDQTIHQSQLNAHHLVRAGDRARKRDEEARKKNADPNAYATAQNTAAIVEIWGGSPQRP